MILRRPAACLFLGLSLLWTLSTLYRSTQGWTTTPSATLQKASFASHEDWVSGDTITLAYRQYNEKANGVPALLLHGNPLAGSAMEGLAEAISPARRIIVPDLPGLGYSSKNLSEFSAINQVNALRLLLDKLEIDTVHLIGYSQGGAVALEYYNQKPGAAKSLTLISAVGLQEHELLGHHDLNLLLYKLYEGALWSARWLAPHFGWLDQPAFHTSTAKNFAHTDLRRNREILSAFEPPALILHGPADLLVPYSAAKAHARLMPHAVFEAFGHGHMGLFQETDALARRIDLFLSNTESGARPQRGQFLARNLEAMQPGMSVHEGSASQGRGILLLSALLFFMVYVSEDLSCIAAGVLASAAALPLQFAILACIAGIWVSDVLVYFIGRRFGTPILEARLFQRHLTPTRVEHFRSAYARNTFGIVLATRFLPGSRVAAYLVAGALKLPATKFFLWLGIAVTLWTPILVGISYTVGAPILDQWKTDGLSVIPKLGLTLLGMYALFRLSLRLSTRRWALQASQSVAARDKMGILASLADLRARIRLRSLFGHQVSLRHSLGAV